MAAIANAGSRLATAVLNKGKPIAAQVWKYGKVELRPPGPSEWGKAMAEGGEVIQSVVSGRFLQQTTKEAAITAVVVADVMFCFFIGEVIGRGSLVGYKIKGAHLDA